MTEYMPVEETIEIPKGTGVEGFMHAVRAALRRPRLQEVRIDARGKITITHFLRQGEERAPLEIDFEALMPYAVVRQGEVVEIMPKSTHAATVVGEMFAAAARDHLCPVAWVASPASHLWRWYEGATAIALAGDFHGLPVLPDRLVEDNVLLLSAGYGRQATFAEIQKSYKIVISQG
ncbi:hypothetical protein LVJ94_35295 [Pendulispora rubella]|uniref:Uncharacterized protein n=1 Tax=Pendulispora rubella TaxID=2741070 RepID=A0ABZ2KU26_9BACT